MSHGRQHPEDPAVPGPPGDELIVHEPGVETPEEQAVEELLETLPSATERQVEALAPAVEDLPPADAAEALEGLGPEQSAEVLSQMEEESAAEALAHMDAALAATVLLDLEIEESAAFIEEMEPDDAADILQALPKPMCEQILRRLPASRAALLGKLALYDPKSAGGVMTTEIQAVGSSMTIGQAIEYIRTHPLLDNQTDVYVVDADRRLIGAITLRQLLFADDRDPVSAHVSKDLDAVLPNLAREEVADIFQKYDYITLPVVDEERRILGMVTVDDVIDIVSAERAEDAMKLVGVREDDAAHGGIAGKFRGRSPWLLMNLLTAQAASAVLLYYHDFIELIPVVAAVFPVIANESGNTGQQSLAVVLRGLVLGQIKGEVVGRLLVREVVTGMLAGALVGLVFCLSIWMLHATGIMPEMSWRLGVVAGVAMAAAMTSACLIGAGIPLILDRLGFDPATASSIFLTMLTDGLSYAIFLSLAFVLQGWWLAPP